MSTDSTNPTASKAGSTAKSDATASASSSSAATSTATADKPQYSEITRKIILAASPSRAMSVAPYLDIAPEALQQLKDDGVTVDVITEKPVTATHSRKRDQDVKDRVVLRRTSLVRISVASLMDERKKLLGAEAVAEEMARAQAAQAANESKTRATA